MIVLSGPVVSAQTSAERADQRFTADTDVEIALLRELMAPTGVPAALATHWADGGAGAETSRARWWRSSSGTRTSSASSTMTRCRCGRRGGRSRPGAADITADAAVRNQIARLQEDGCGRYPVCVAKTQYSFSTDAKLLGAPSGHIVNVREVRLAAGAEFVVKTCGDITTRPPFPQLPAAERIDLGRTGKWSECPERQSLSERSGS